MFRYDEHVCIKILLEDWTCGNRHPNILLAMAAAGAD